MNKDEQYTKLLQLVKKAHKGQTRNGGHLPYWHHCYRASQLLFHVFNQTKEGRNQDNHDIVLAALGHDLYEDTKITRFFIETHFGVGVDKLIHEVTNEEDDVHLDSYMKKLQSNSEAASLVKLADLCDNIVDGTYSIHENGKQLTKKWQKILDRQWQFLQKKKFKQYPLSAALLKTICASAYAQLLAELTT